ncbi:hypothetical protein [Streptomyces sp. NPDC007369]|uniref:hypothetical protein n=1 Tax=Streptomyces sp. NPDC007369 TaxID=3154589 RepID=UPI0034057B11
MVEAKLDQLARLWEDFRSLPFPRGFYRREPDGTCMVSMDMYLAGCVLSAMNGPLDDWRRDVLLKDAPVLEKILPSIADDDYAAKYFAHLHAMAVLAAEIDTARSA